MRNRKTGGATRIFRPFVIGIAAILGAVLVAALFGLGIALFSSKPGEIAGSLGSVVGGMIGALGAALAVYLTLSTQRQEDRRRIDGALGREVAEFARQVVRGLETCETILSEGLELPRARLPEAMEMPQPIIYPAVADKVGVLSNPQRAVAFYTHILEIGILARDVSRTPLAETTTLTQADLQALVLQLVYAANLAELIIKDLEPEDDFGRRANAQVLRDLRHQISLARDRFHFEDEERAR